MLDAPQHYPGEIVTPSQIKLLADEYAEAARVLTQRGNKKRPISFAPARMVALHAIELNLTAFLRLRGYSSKAIRSLGHDLSERALRAKECGLNLRENTTEHLAALNDRREYLAMRYDAESVGGLAQMNRIISTLDEVGRKVGSALAQRTDSISKP